MALLNVFAGASAAIYAALALGWLIQVVRHRQEAVKIHWLLVLFPLCNLVPTLTTIFVQTSTSTIINAVFSLLMAAVTYIVLGLAASGYSVIILPHGQMLTIIGLALFGAFLSASVFAAVWVSYLVLVVEIIQYVYLVKVAMRFTVEAGVQHAAHADQGLWLINPETRKEVSRRTLRAIWVYVIGLIVLVVIGVVAETYVVFGIASDSTSKTTAELQAEIQEKIAEVVGPLMLATALLCAIVFLMLAYAYQLGHLHHHGHNYEQAGLLAPPAHTEAGMPVQTYGQPAYQPTGQIAHGQTVYQPAYGQPSAPQY